MILLKTDRTNKKKNKVYHYDLKTDYEPEMISLVDDKKIPANTLYKTCKEKIETLNKRLERCRLIERALECSFNRNTSELLKEHTVPLKINKTKGHFLKFIDSNNGIFIH